MTTGVGGVLLTGLAGFPLEAPRVNTYYLALLLSGDIWVARYRVWGILNNLEGLLLKLGDAETNMEIQQSRSA